MNAALLNASKAWISQSRLPPYGKKAALLQSKNVKLQNDIYLFAGSNAWHKAKVFCDRQVVLCLPVGSDPSKYTWPVKNCGVILFDTGGLNHIEIEFIAYQLLMAGATIVRASYSNSKLVIYRGQHDDATR